MSGTDEVCPSRVNEIRGGFHGQTRPGQDGRWQELMSKAGTDRHFQPWAKGYVQGENSMASDLVTKGARCS